MPAKPKRLAKSREAIFAFRQIPNIGAAMEEDFRRLKIDHPHRLAGQDPYALYDRLNTITGVRHDPCVLDTFIAAVRYMEGAPKTPWWKYTKERKQRLGAPAGGVGKLRKRRAAAR